MLSTDLVNTKYIYATVTSLGLIVVVIHVIPLFYFFPGATTKFYIVLEVTNLSKKNFTLEASDRYPPQGFSIKSGTVARITKAVSRPSAVIFTARDVATKEPLVINGLYNVSVTPSKSELQEAKLTITREGI